MTSPLAFSENSMKTSWSLSAKLQLRSNSPSRFSLDSRASPPLERIGEACDDKVSTSCFGSYSRQDRHANSKAPLATVEGYGSEGGHGKRILDDAYCRSSKSEHIDTVIDQDKNISPLKEHKRKGSSSEKHKGESIGTKKTHKTDLEKSSKKRHSSSSTTKSSSQASSSSLLKNAKVTNTNKDSGKTVKGLSSWRMDSSSGQKASVQETQCKVHPSPSPQPSVSHSVTLKKSSFIPAITSKKSLAERTSNRDVAHLNSPVNKARGCGIQRSSQPLGADRERMERKPVRSSSSSSSITSLRSPSISSRDLNPGSKSEDKGLSFLKSALRQREIRRSADLGKTTLLSKKTSERTAKSSTQTKGCSMDDDKGSSGPSQGYTLESKSNKIGTKQKASSKVTTPVKHSLLPVSKSKSSMTENTGQTCRGKKPLERK